MGRGLSSRGFGNRFKETRTPQRWPWEELNARPRGPVRRQRPLAREGPAKARPKKYKESTEGRICQ